MCCNILECIAIEAVGLGWEFVLQYKNCIATVEQGQGWTVLQYSGHPSHDTAGAGQQARAGRAAGALACGTGAGKRANVGAGALGAQSLRQAGLGSARSAADARGKGAQATGDRRAGRHGVGTQGREAGLTERVGHGRLSSIGAHPVRTGWASWALVHPTWFSTWFFDSVFFLSHQMNTVHCKINVFEKKKLNIIKIKSNQIKFDKILEK